MKHYARLILFTLVIAAAALMPTMGLAQGSPRPLADSAAPAGRVIYVNAGASGGGGGTGWGDAYKHLQDALAAAQQGDEIWVARGVYYPDEGSGQTNGDRNSTFELKNGVEIYGGFAGNETSRDQRDPNANVTVLSGDIDGNDSTDHDGVVQDPDNARGNNAYNVVLAANVGESTVLDGFTITAGKADGAFPQDRGGGIHLYNSNARFRDIKIVGNYASGAGGGMNIVQGDPDIEASSFLNNRTDQWGGGVNVQYLSNPTFSQITVNGNRARDGGGMAVYNSDATVIDSTVTNNTSDDSGGGIWGWYSMVYLRNNTVAHNRAGGGSGTPMSAVGITTRGVITGESGGGVYHDQSTITMTNVIIANNTGGDCVDANGSTLAAGSSNNLIEDASNACGLTDGANGNIIGRDPKLGPLTDFGGPGRQVHPLLAGSPAIDAGTNINCPATDQRGVSRPQDGDRNGSAICDIGAYEAGEFALHLPLVLSGP